MNIYRSIAKFHILTYSIFISIEQSLFVTNHDDFISDIVVSFTFSGGLNRCIHSDEYDISLVIKRAEWACRESYKGKYGPTSFNCEHMVNSCRRIGGSQGYSIQMGIHGKHMFPNPSTEGTEHERLVDPVQVDDDGKPDDIFAIDD